MPAAAQAADTVIPAAVTEASARVATLLEQLDALALACLEWSDNNAAGSCEDFQAALNGPLLRDYLLHCTALKDWRAQLARNWSTPTTATEAPLILEHVLAIEALCGDGALLQQAGYVQRAYQTLGQADATLSRQEFQALRQDQLMEQERQRLLESMEEQQRRQRQETQHQLDRQELERIRQLSPR